MSIVLNREYQNMVLSTLAEMYPDIVDTDTFNSFFRAAESPKQFYGTLLYLEDHGLICSGISQGIDGHHSINLGSLKITHKGLDFIADDGGLSAILNVVTVKLDAETIKALIIKRVEESNASETEKSKIKSFLSSVGDKTLSRLTTHLVDYSLSQGQSVIDWLLKNIDCG